MSLLSPYIPIGLAMKGLEKSNPKVKSFLGGAASAGYSANEAIDFLRNEFSSPGNKEVRAQTGHLRADEEAGKRRLEHEQAPQRLAQGAAALGAGALGGLGSAALTGASQLAQTVNEEEKPSANAEQPSTQPGGFQEFIKQNPELGAYLDSLMQKGMDPIQAASQAKKHRKFGPLVQSIEGQMGQSFEDLMAQLFQGSQGNGQNTSQNSRPSGQNTSQSGGDSELIAALQQILKM